jgi:hypothetical protein
MTRKTTGMIWVMATKVDNEINHIAFPSKYALRDFVKSVDFLMRKLEKHAKAKFCFGTIAKGKTEIVWRDCQ